MKGQTRGSNLKRRPGADRLAGTIGLLLALALVALTPAYAAGQDLPEIPDFFEGTATINGEPVEPGTIVESFVAEETERRSWTSLFEYEGDSWYTFNVPRQEFDEGKVVRFKVGGEWANETHTFGPPDVGDLYRIDLTIDVEPVIVEYDLTIGSTEGGSVTTPGEGTSARAAGTAVSLVAVAAEGYEFTEWTATAGDFDDKYAATTTFAMPESDATITAHFQEEDDTVFWTLTMAASPLVGGSISPTAASYLKAEGELVNISASAATGYQFSGWTASPAVAFGNAASPSTSFTMPSNDVLITAQFTLTPTQNPDPFAGLGCFIATAAYGTDSAVQIDILREFRDTVLMPNRLGAAFVSLYYRTSPPIAEFISRHETLRTVVRVGFVDPVVGMIDFCRALWSGEHG
jgi:uncharacterized repeat protein (TIGR02543 family)